MQKWLSGLKGKLGKYKYAALAVLLGMGILLWPKTADSPKTEIASEQSISATNEKEALQQSLTKLLCQMNGVGDAEVLLSLDSAAKNSYWQDQDGSNQTQTVFAQVGNEKTPAMKTYEYPKYRGAVIVCDGADNARVQLCVKEAVSSLTGLGSDKIAVIKMKMH